MKLTRKNGDLIEDCLSNLRTWKQRASVPKSRVRSESTANVTDYSSEDAEEDIMVDRRVKRNERKSRDHHRRQRSDDATDYDRIPPRRSKSRSKKEMIRKINKYVENTDI